jgi:UDP-glucose 4-epimerase
MNSKPVLITGGAGFIGSHVSDALLAKGYRVRILDNLSTGKRTNLQIKHSHLEFVLGDVADAQTVEMAVNGCQSVIHLAAVASVQASVDDPVATHQANFIGTLNVCEAMRRQGLKRVLYASSAAIYGETNSPVIHEDAQKAPLTPYASDKLAGEHYLEFYQRAHGIDPVVFRFFNIFGPRQDPSSPYSGVISIFCERALNGLPITVFGDGQQTRDFFFVADLVKLIVQALEMPESPQKPINIGYNGSTTLNEVLSVLSDILGTALDIRYEDARPGDIRHSRANNDRLINYFGLQEPTHFQEGLATLISV